MKNVIGIDLGTTNCCVAMMVDGRPKVIEDEKGYNILPSYIAIKGPNKFIVGHGAKSQAISNPRQTLRAVKRLIGRKINTPEVEEAKGRMGFDIIEGPNYDILLRIGETTMTPTDASSVLLKCIKGIAEKYLGREVNEAVITCPAYFTNAQRKATIEAGQKAGLRILRLLNEPTAAALAFGYKKDLERRLLIYDLGGGTFDVSILEVGDNVYEVLATNGDSFLGGEDFDNRLVDHLAADFRESHGVDLRGEPVALQRLKDAAERAKCELSFVDKTQVMIPHVQGTSNLQAELTRDALEALTEDLVKKTFDVVVRTLEEANLAVSDIDEFILVGGQTRMPRIQEMVKSFFGKPACKGVHPDEAVAIGACVHADALTEDKGDILLLDVTPFALGIDSAGDIFTQIVAKNSTIPVAESRTFTTVVDNQEKVKIVVRQGEVKRASENRFLGEFVLTGIRRAPKMEPKIDVVFRIDSNGILNVSAKDRFTGERQSIVIKDYFERATNPDHDGAPVVVSEREGATADGATMTSDQPAGGEGASEPAKAKKGILSRLVGGFGKGGKKKQKDAVPEEFGEGVEGEEAEGSVDEPAPSVVSEGEAQGDMREEAALSTAASQGEPRPPLPPQSGPPLFDPYGVVPLATDTSADVERVSGREEREFEQGAGTAPPGVPPWKDPFAGAGQGGAFGDRYDDPFAVTEKDDPFATGPDPFAMSGTAGDPFGKETVDPYAIKEKQAQEQSASVPSSTRRPAPVDLELSREEDLLNSLDLDTLVDELEEERPAVGGAAREALVDVLEVPTDMGGAKPSSPYERPAGDIFSEPGDEDSFAIVERERGDGAGRRTKPGAVGAARDLSGGALPIEREEDIKLPSGFIGDTASTAGVVPGDGTRSELPSGFVDELFEGRGVAGKAGGGDVQSRAGGGAFSSGSQAGGIAGAKKKPARLKIAYRRVDAFVSEYSENLNRGGTFIKTPKPLELGRECVFELTIPSREAPIVLKGVVVWSSKGLSDLQPGQEQGMGIKYLFDDQQGRKEVERLLDELRIAG